ncbi:MAG: PAS domain-containing protein [Clostridium sp.]|nr:PAS domain-containing protein [Clostridium sp.]
MKETHMECKINHRVFIIVKNDKVIKCSDAFINLTQYPKKSFINKTIKDLCKLLKINSKSELKNMSYEHSYYMFKKDCKPIEIIIEKKEAKDETIFYFDYNKTSWLDDKFEFVKQIYSDSRKCIAIFSYPDCRLLVSNQRFLNVLGKPFDKKEVSSGEKVDDIVRGYCGSRLQDKVKMNVLKAGKPIKLNKQLYITRHIGQ